MSLSRVSILAAFVCCLGVTAVAAPPSKLSPRGTKFEQHVAQKYNNWWERLVALLGRKGLALFSEPVHEEITTRIFGCDGARSLCGDPNVEFAGPFVLAGVRWNDDPPFRIDPAEFKNTSCKSAETIRFTTQPRCWYELFKQAKRSATLGKLQDAESRAPLLARSHFGDLQFLHAMASQDGEPASETRTRVLMWSEFGWRVASGEYRLDTKLSAIPIDGFQHFFGKSGWTVQDLFTAGNPALRPHIQDVAFGSVLHTVEDSFALGHAARETAPPPACANGLPVPSRIIEFHSYTNQNESKHAEEDARAAFERGFTGAEVNVVTVGRPLFKFYQEKAPWETVKPYFECVFTVIDPMTPASAGAAFAAMQ